MKKITVYFVAAALMLFFSGIRVQAQDEKTDLDLPVLGIGLHVEQFKANELMLSYTSSLLMTTFTVPINLTDHFRLEPEIGFMVNTEFLTSEDEDEDDREYNSSGFYSGLGAYYMFQRERLNFYAGAKFRIKSATMEGHYIINGESAIEKGFSFGLGPVLGFEYFFGNHFSFGGELGLDYDAVKSKTEYSEDPYNPGYPYYEDEETTSTIVHFNSGLYIRAYF